MISGSISRRYAKALLSLGIETHQYEAFGKVVEDFAQLLTHEALHSILEDPSVPHAKRKAILEALLDRSAVSGNLRNFFLLLLDRNRLESLPAIAREYQRLSDQYAGRIRAQVTSAAILTPEEVQRIKKALEHGTGKQVLLEHKEDSDLIAGMVTKIGSVIYDGSLRTKLKMMQEALLEGS